jgi:6-phosphogluconolactonase/glucosamine-6-phosphate isomerase/deaminase
VSPALFLTRETTECANAGSPKNTHILNGNAEDLYKECEDYEDAIKSVGGIDLFLGGIGAG